MRLLHVRPAGYLPERVSLPDITLSIDLTVFYTSLSLMEDSAMDSLLSAYKTVGDCRYREISGLYWEDFTPGDVFEHRPGRTVLDADNVWFTLLTLNVQQVHFDAAYASKTEWKKLLVDSTFTLALLTGMSVRTVSAKVVANLGWDKVKATHPCSPVTRFMPKVRYFINACQTAAQVRGSSRCKPVASIKMA